MYELSVKTHFSGAHHLVGYDGPCAEHHGHNWEVEVFVCGKKLNKTGILVDFKKLKESVKQVTWELDHKDVNKHPFFQRNNPTSENIARFIYEQVLKLLKKENCRINKVVVKETPDSTAVYSK